MAGRSLQITYVGDASRVLAAQQQINRGHTTMQTGTQKAAGFMQQAFGVTMPLAAAAAAAGVVALGKTIVTAAADQNEAVNVVNVTFGRAADKVKGFAETSAESFGISETAALQAAGGFGSMLKTAGLAGDALATMSTKVVGLAGDLASFKNVAPEEALEKLRSGLAGEAEPLRTFGVFLSEARVEALAYKSGIADVGTELTEAQKIQARYQLILQDTTDAHGDFARTLGESLPNQMRALRGELEDLEADLGQALLPVALEVAKALVSMVEALGPLLDLVGQAAPAFRIFGEAMAYIMSPAKFVYDRLSDLGGLLGGNTIDKGLEQIGKQFRDLADTIRGPAIGAAKDFIPFLFKVGDAAKEGGKGVDKMSDSFDDLKFSLDDVATATEVSKHEFIRYFRTLEENSRELLTASRELLKEKWINPDFVEFLSTKGPGYLTEFADLNTRKQMKFQEDWEESNRRTNQANRNIIDILDTLNRLDRGTSNHTVKIHYEYVGFDPTKPGMVGVGGREGATSHGGPQ